MLTINIAIYTLEALVAHFLSLFQCLHLACRSFKLPVCLILSALWFRSFGPFLFKFVGSFVDARFRVEGMPVCLFFLNFY